MKITFGHLNLCYPNPEQIQIQVEAETDFEVAYLKSLVNLKHDFQQFEWIHPGNAKATCVLRAKKSLTPEKE